MVNVYYFTVTCYQQDGFHCKKWNYGTVIKAGSKSEAYQLAEKELLLNYSNVTVYDFYLTDCEVL